MFLKAREYFDADNQVDADVLDVTSDGAVLAMDHRGIPSNKFAWLEFMLGQNRSVKALGRVETIETADTGVVVSFAFKHIFPDDRKVLLDYLGAGA